MREDRASQISEVGSAFAKATADKGQSAKPERSRRLEIGADRPLNCGGIAPAKLAGMKKLFPAVISRCFCFTPLAAAFFSLTSCSKTDVNLASQPSPPPIVVTQSDSPQKKAADRMVEIDRLLAQAPTGRPEDSDRRTALRAEREALITSGQVAYRNVPQSFTSKVANTPPNNTVTRTVNGNVEHFAAPTTRTEPITVATNSQDKNLSFLEQMTPTEREHYYKTLKLQNTQRLNVDVQRR